MNSAGFAALRACARFRDPEKSRGAHAAAPIEIGADWAYRLAEGLRLAGEARERASGGSARFLDIRFGDLVGRELEQVRRIYDCFGMELRPEVESRMRRFQALSEPGERREAKG